MTAAEAHAAAAMEGLVLVRADNASGFKNVSLDSAVSKRFLAHGGRKEYLGQFATAEEAALTVARFLGPEGVAAALAAPKPVPAPMTAAEARATAVSEGLTLVGADNATGFMYVSRANCASKPFEANVKRGGCRSYLGQFVTAEEAALAVARFLGPEGAAAAPTPPTPEPAAERSKFQRVS